MAERRTVWGVQTPDELYLFEDETDAHRFAWHAFRAHPVEHAVFGEADTTDLLQLVARSPRPDGGDSRG